MSRFSCLSVALLFCLVAAVPAAAAAPLRAGAGRAEITPPVGAPLGGYSERNAAPSTGVRAPLFARALALEAGGTEVVLVSAELIGIPAALTEAAAERAGLPREQLLLFASHTHSGPGAFGGDGVFAQLSLGPHDDAVFELLAERIAAAVRQARADLAPARFGHGSVELPEYTRNRRGGERIDPQLTVLRVDRADGRPLAALFHYATHGTLLGAENMEFSGDWIGAAQRALEAAVPGLTALYASGAAGDQAPRAPDGKRGAEGVEALGRAVADAAARVYRQIEPRETERLAVRERPHLLRVDWRVQQLGFGLQTRLQVVELGEVLLAAIPGEMTVALGDQIRAHARERGWQQPLIVGLANDHLGYLLTREEHRAGGYEARTSFFGARFGEQLARAVNELIGEPR